MTISAATRAAPPSATSAAEDGGETLLKLADVERITTLGKSTIYRKVDDGSFPKPRRAGENCIRWLRSDITAWMRQLPQS